MRLSESVTHPCPGTEVTCTQLLGNQPALFPFPNLFLVLLSLPERLSLKPLVQIPNLSAGASDNLPGPGLPSFGCQVETTIAPSPWASAGASV